LIEPIKVVTERTKGWLNYKPKASIASSTDYAYRQ